MVGPLLDWGSCGNNPQILNGTQLSGIW